MKAVFIDGFSKLSQEERIIQISKFTSSPGLFISDVHNLMHPDKLVQNTMNGFSENTLANFPLPYGIAPNFKINGKDFAIPMVIEESSVVAAASSAAKFWYKRGGFTATVIDQVKSGQIYFTWKNKKEMLIRCFPDLKRHILKNISPITERMEKRGGGVTDIILSENPEVDETQYRLDFKFRTADSMGANFINSVLEESSVLMRKFLNQLYPENIDDLDILMSILSNYTPECTVRIEVQMPVDELESLFPGINLTARIIRAVRIAETDVKRAVTHNKGILNGIDAVLIATGNDYRAVEAGAHAWAARTGQYKSLSYAVEDNGVFRFGMELPMAVGTVGGLTSIHPLAKWSLDILGNPGAGELMMIIAAAGLANNFSAVKSLVTTGIQKGHMKLHLENILNFLGATETEKLRAIKHFRDRTISYFEVKQFLNSKEV